MMPITFDAHSRPARIVLPLTAAAVLCACGGEAPTEPDGGDPPPTVVAARVSWITDWDNFGDGRDLVVEIDFPADRSGIAEYRMMVVKEGAAGSFDLAAAAAVPPSRFRTIPATASETRYDAGADGVDVDGDPVGDGGSYVVFVYSVATPASGAEDRLGSASSPLSLTVNDLVRTISEPIDGGSGGLEVDAAGDIYSADFGATLSGGGRSLFRITPEGEVSVFYDGLDGGSGNALASNGDIFQASISANRIERVAPDGTATVVAEGPPLQQPVGLSVHAGDADTLYVANCGGLNVVKVAPDGTMSIFAASALMRCPNGITRASDGNLYVSNFGNGDVVKIGPEGTVSRHATLPGNNNGHILFGNGVLYVVARSAHQIWEVTLEGEATLLAGSGIQGGRDGGARTARLSFTNDIALSPAGDVLYFNDVGTFGEDQSILSPVVIRAVHLAGATGGAAENAPGRSGILPGHPSGAP